MKVPGRNNIEIEADHVIKRGDPRLLAIEAEKTRRAREIGHVTGLFRVPAVISYEPEAGRLVLERLHHIVPLSVILTGDRDRQPLLTRIGRCLGAIHDHLRLPEDMLIRWAEPWWLEMDPGAVLHGDFNYSNVQIDQVNDCPAIIDWSPTPWLGVNETVGPREYDIVYFLRGLFFTRRRWWFLSRRARHEGNAFIAGYFEQTGYRPSVELFVRYLDHLGKQVLKISNTSAMKPWNRADYLMNASRYSSYVRSRSFRRVCEKCLDTVVDRDLSPQNHREVNHGY